MKTALIIYAAASFICLLRLALDKETTSFKKFINYWYHPFIPIYNFVMVWFIIRDLWRKDKVIFVCSSVLVLIIVLTLIFTL